MNVKTIAVCGAAIRSCREMRPEMMTVEQYLMFRNYDSKPL